MNKGRNNDGKVIHAEYDVMYQRERGMRERGCGGSVNSGVVYMSNSTAVHEVYKPRMMQARESIVMGTAGRLDQVLVVHMFARIDNDGSSYCARHYT